MRLEERDVEALMPDPENAKHHTDEQVAMIAASIEAGGFLDPVGVTEEGMVVEGHGRLLAARRLGMRTVPVLVLDPMSERERRAYAVAHNQANANSGLDMAGVVEEFERLGAGADDVFAAGFTEEQVLFWAAEPEETDEFVAPRTTGQSPQKGGGKRVAALRKTKVAFETGEQERVFLVWLGDLQARYPDIETVGGRIAAYVKENTSV